ncbi:MAG: hypothetical protein O7B25_16555 [Gammaproteobacteria bacterium]|nr:hypothetical protein [Gammaproteobacteria bacterium]
MSTLEISQLANGDVVLRDPDEEGEPLVQIRFSAEVKDMLGEELVGVAEAMIDAATGFLEGGSPQYHDGDGEGHTEYDEENPARTRVVH